MANFNPNSSVEVKNGNGKRERVVQDDDQEFMPLSKRINNIHLSPELNGHVRYSHDPNHHQQHLPLPPELDHHGHGHIINGHHRVPEIVNGVRDLISSPSTSTASSSVTVTPQFHHTQNHLTVSHNVAAAVSVAADDQSDSSAFNPHNQHLQYRPSLTRTDNPHYYEANRTLFDLYLERMTRHNHTPHPSVYLNPNSQNNLN